MWPPQWAAAGTLELVIAAASADEWSAHAEAPSAVAGGGAEFVASVAGGVMDSVGGRLARAWTTAASGAVELVAASGSGGRTAAGQEGIWQLGQEQLWSGI